MNAKEIKELVRIVEESNISELEVSRWGKKVRILKTPANSNHRHRSNSDSNNQEMPVEHSIVATPALQHPAPETTQQLEATKTAPLPVAPETKLKIEEIRSPMVGTFYKAPAPDAEPYVKEGDKIGPGKVLCIIEAMKLMNEIEAEISGSIQEILVENSQPVEYNQPLFKVAIE